MVSLVSVASSARGLHEFIRNDERANKELLKVDFAQGDIVSTIIKCAHGQTIALTLDTTLPRPYSRNFTVRGTRGMYQEDNGSIFFDTKNRADHFRWRNEWGNVAKYREEFEHPIWNRFIHDGVRGGHGGMDWLEFDAFFGAIERGITPPIDTYDTAAWMAITPLSEESIATGLPVAIPDFTRGAWTHRDPPPQWEYTI